MEAVRALRTRKAEELGLDKGVLLSNAQINLIVRKNPSSNSELRAVPGVRSWQVEILGEDVLGVLG